MKTLLGSSALSSFRRQKLLETARTLADSILPAAGADLQVAIAALLRERGALGAFGFVTLVMTSSLVFGAVNRALGCIFERRASLAQLTKPQPCLTEKQKRLVGPFTRGAVAQCFTRLANNIEVPRRRQGVLTRPARRLPL